MALTLQDQNYVWQKVNRLLGVQFAGTGAMAAAVNVGPNPASANAFRALKLQMATQLKGIQLQFVPFAQADVDAATGYIVGVGACTLYGIWCKKIGTGTTAQFLGVYDKNTNATSTDQKSASLYTKTQYDESFAMSPTGWPHTNATGPTIASCTTIAGGTQTASDADSVYGFAILGA